MQSSTWLWHGTDVLAGLRAREVTCEEPNVAYPSIGVNLEPTTVAAFVGYFDHEFLVLDNLPEPLHSSFKDQHTLRCQYMP